MSDKLTIQAELLQLCGKVRDQAAAPNDVRRLDALLRSSEQARDFYVLYMHVASLLESRGASTQPAGRKPSTADEPDVGLLFELLNAERQANAAVVLPTQEPAPALATTATADRPSLREIGSVAGHLITRPAVWGPIAAVLAIALTLVLVFSGNQTPGPIAQRPQQPAPTTPERRAVATQIVATLTAEHDAHWSTPGLSRGDSLFAGQTLTLTQGFAEITTNRGAVAILEAPATIELLDNDNALRLHTGRLVGICETQSSKGFTVRTAHMYITDLGTEFGVEVFENNFTATVFTGTIEVETISGERLQLNYNQTARLTVEGNNRELIFEDQIAEGFTRRIARQAVLIAADVENSGPNPAARTSEVNQWGWSSGMQFTVSTDINVTELGKFDIEGDGIVGTDVGLYNVDSGELLATASLTGTSPQRSNGKDAYYAPITPVTLTPGTTYAVMALYTTTEKVTWGISQSFAPEVNLVQGVAHTDESALQPTYAHTHTMEGSGYYGGTFKFTVPRLGEEPDQS